MFAVLPNQLQKPVYLFICLILFIISVECRSRYFIDWDYFYLSSRGYPIDVCQAMGYPSFGFMIYKCNITDTNNHIVIKEIHI